MQNYNIIFIFDKNLENLLMCKRAKEPYKGKYNLVAGKIEKENDNLNEAYRELFEETAITKDDINLKHFMNLEYLTFNIKLEVYYGILNKEVILVEEVNKLKWIDINDNFFDIDKYAGEGNIGHMLEEIKIDIAKNKPKQLTYKPKNNKINM
ncbi:MAG: NUDIX domain-containing protein [Bacilli bacterium]|nr:NUDIX domain-containing protein [Bacilli bacterium]